MINFNKIYLLSEEESNSKKPEQKNPKRMTAAQKKAEEERKEKERIEKEIAKELKYQQRAKNSREREIIRRDALWAQRADVRAHGEKAKRSDDLYLRSDDPEYFSSYLSRRREFEKEKLKPIEKPEKTSGNKLDEKGVEDNNLVKIKYTDLLPSPKFEELKYELIKGYPGTTANNFENLFDKLSRDQKYDMGVEHFIIGKKDYIKYLGENGNIPIKIKEIKKFKDLKDDYASIKIDSSKGNFVVVDPESLRKIANIKAANYEDAISKKNSNKDWGDYKVYDEKSISTMISNIETAISTLEKKYEEQKKELKNILQPQYKMAYQMKHKNESQNSNVWFVTNEEGDVLKIIKSDNISEAESKFNDIVKTSKYNCHLINLSEVKTEIVAQTEDVVIATPDGTTRTMTPDQKVKAQKALQKEPIKIVKRGMPIQEDQVEEKFSSKLENLINAAVKKINELSESSEDKKYKKVLENVVKNLMNAQKALESVKSHESYVEEKKNIEDEKLAVKNVGSVRKQISKIVKDKEIVDRIMRKYNSDVAKKLQKKAPDADPEKLSKAIVKYFIKESKQQLDSILSEAESIEQVKKKFVDTNKISKEVFDEILKVSRNNKAYVAWLAKNVVGDKEREIEPKIEEEDIYKYEKFFKLFEKRRKDFKYPNIEQYKDNEVEEFEKDAIEVNDKLSSIGVNIDSGKTSNLVSPENIKVLEENKIEFLGTVEGYQVFKIPKGSSNDKETYEAYRRILGKCGQSSSEDDSEVDSKINICTFASFNHFKNYTSGDDLYVFFNRSDSLSPYQFSYSEKQFHDRKNQSVI